MAEIYRKFDQEEIEQIFSYHPPNEKQRETYEQINLAFIKCAEEVAALMPDGPSKTAAIRKMADARMACNASVALEGKF